MSYITTKRSRAVVRRKRRRGLGDSFADILDAKFFGNSRGADYDRCAAAATQEEAALDAQTYDLAQNWHPLDTVSPSDLKNLVDNMMALVQSATSLNERAASESDSSEVAQFRRTISNIAEQCASYYTSIAAAQKAGAAACNAPGLKDWVTISMANLSAAMHDSYVVHCMTSWFVLLFNAMKGFFMAVYAAAKAIVGVVLKLGEKLVDTVEHTFDLIKVIEDYAPLAIVGLAAWWIFLREKKRTGTV